MKLTRIKDKKPEYGQRVLVMANIILFPDATTPIRHTFLARFSHVEGIPQWETRAGEFRSVDDLDYWCELPEWPEEGK